MARQSFQLEADAVEMVLRAVESTGLSKAEFIRRLLRWFDSQQDVVQQEVLGILPASLRTKEVAEMVLKRMAENDQPDVAGQIRPTKSPGVSRRKKASKKRGQDESRGGKS